jgi:hypothetical protein
MSAPSFKPREFWIESYIESHAIVPAENAIHRYIHVLEAAPVLERIKELEADLNRQVALIFQRNCEIKDLKAENAKLKEAVAKAILFLNELDKAIKP